jgi:beta-glucosidase-like glycosyl hydrolase
MDKAQARMSDLLAFQIAMEHADPGSVMCSYNKVWGDHACESAFLLNDVLRRDWGWRGYVMSDWGATHSTAKAASSGLDQQSGYPFDDKPYFGELMLAAVKSGEVKEAKLNEMVHRIVRTLFAKGVIDHPVKAGPIDFAAHSQVTRAGAEQGAVLLKNAGNILPLKDQKRIAVIGGYADKGVAGGRRFVAGVSHRRKCRARSQADELAGTHHVSPLVAAARHPGAGAAGQGWNSPAARIAKPLLHWRRTAMWCWCSPRSGTASPSIHRSRSRTTRTR